MINDGVNSFSQLEAAVAAWNAKVAGAYGELSESLRMTKRKLDVVQKVLSVRRALSADHIQMRIKEAEDPEAELHAAVARLNLLDQTLTSFHVELRTLHAQAGRAVAAGDILSDELVTLQDSADAAMQAAQGELPGLEAGPESWEEAEDLETAALVRMENERLIMRMHGGGGGAAGPRVLRPTLTPWKPWPNSPGSCSKLNKQRSCP